MVGGLRRLAVGRAKVSGNRLTLVGAYGAPMVRLWCAYGALFCQSEMNVGAIGLHICCFMRAKRFSHGISKVLAG